jgi:hypothetical protein
MRDLLLERVRPLVDKLAADIVELVTSRIETELARVGESFHVALSAYASQEPHADSDRRDHDPVPQVRRRAARELPQRQHAEVPRPAQAPSEGREEGQRAAGLVISSKAQAVELFGAGTGAVNLVEYQLARTAAQPPQRPFNVPAAPAPSGQSTDKGAKQANGKAWPSCSICKKVGVTARTHPAHVDGTPAAAAPKVDRLAVIATRAKKPEPVIEDEQDGEPERWTPSRIAKERDIAEGRKHEGEMPSPRSSFGISARGEVEELNFDEAGQGLR